MVENSARFRVRSRAAGGAGGAPATLLTGELGYNMADGRFYVGFGDDGNGVATSIKTIAADDFTANVPAGGAAAQVLRKNEANDGYEWQTLSEGMFYSAGNGLTLENGGTEFRVNFGIVAKLASPAFSGAPTAPTAPKGTATEQLATTGFTAAALADYAPKDSAELTGAPTAPTAAQGTNNTTIATTAFVIAELAAIRAGASAAYDTFFELQQLLEQDASGLAALTTTVAGKLQKDQNLADLTDKAAARGNLALKGMAQQAPDAVAITGGTITGVVLDGGSF